MHLIGFPLRATQLGMKISTKNTEVLCLSGNPRHTASKRQYTVAGREVQVPWVVFTSDEMW